MSTTLAKILLMLFVAAVLCYGFYIRPQGRRPVSVWQLAAVFAVGLLVGAILLSTHSLYIPGNA